MFIFYFRMNLFPFANSMGFKVLRIHYYLNNKYFFLFYGRRKGAGSKAFSRFFCGMDRFQSGLPDLNSHLLMHIFCAIGCRMWRKNSKMCCLRRKDRSLNEAILE